MANINISQIRMKRGNTAAAGNYVGPLGELLVDTGLQTIRIQDGVTPGGWIVTAGEGGGTDLTAVNASITSLTANAGTQQTQINSINANVIAANSAIVTANINVVSFVNTLTSALRANITAANASIITSNTALKAYTDSAISTAINNLINSAPGTLDTLGEIAANLAADAGALSGIITSITSINSNVSAANAAIITANLNLKNYVDNQISTISLTPGPQGNVGPQGIQGNVGPQGIQGNVGPQGNTGAQGIQGIQGNVGPQGIQGIQGTQGEPGGNANTADLAFVSNAMYNFAGVIVENADLEHNATASLILPTNGATGTGSDVQLNNSYSNVVIGTGTDSDLNNFWTFGTDGKLTFPDSTQQTTAWAGQAANIGTITPTTTTGSFWYDTEDGRLYVNNGDAWVDTNPTIAPDPSFYLGNLTVDDRTINSDDSQYTFGTDGTFTTPWGKIGAFGGPGLTMMANVDQNQQFTGMFVGNTESPSQGYLSVLPQSAAIGVTNTDTGDSYSWQFESTGNLTIPGNINYANGVSILNGITAGGGYGNVDVAAYLANYDGEINFTSSPAGISNATLISTFNANVTNELTVGSTIVTPTGNIVANSSLSIKTPNTSGIPSSVANWNSGGGWNAGSYSNLATTGGTGSGLTVDITGAFGYLTIDNIAIHTPGTGYTDGDVITIVNENGGGGTFTITTRKNTWEFDNTGNLTIPGNINYANGVSILSGISAGSGTVSSLVNGSQTLSLNSDGTVTMPLGSVIKATTDSYTGISTSDGNTFAYVDSGGFYVITLYNTAEYEWNFDNTGTLTTPGNVVVAGNLIVQGNTYQNDRELFVSSAGEAVEFANGGNIFAPAGLGNIVVSTNTSQYNWTFGTDGELYLPTGGRIGFAGKGWTGLDGGNGAPTSLTSYYPSGMYSSCLTAGPSGSLSISTYGDGTGLTNNWNFDSTGITFLDNSVQATAWTGAIANIGNVTPTTVTAVSGAAWYNTDDGRLYIKDGSSWVDASPAVIPAENIYLGNLTVTDRTIYSDLAGWQFGADGNLTFPGGNLTIGQYYDSPAIVAAAGNNISIVASGVGAGYEVGSSLIWLDSITEPTKVAGVVANDPFYVGAGDVGIVTGDYFYHGTTNLWNFGNDGNLTLPTNGNINYANGQSILSGITASGGSTNTGNITFNGSDITGTGSNVTITANTTDWTFYANANLVLPTNATITYANGTSILDGIGGSANIIFSGSSSVSASDADGVQITSAGHNWFFGNTGNLTLPGGSTITENGALILTPTGASSEQKLKIYPTEGGSEGDHIHLTSGDLSVTSIFLGSDSQYVRTQTNGDIVIGTNDNTPDGPIYSSNRWTFGNTGTLTLPRNNKITSANTPQVGYRIVVTDDVVGASETDNPNEPGSTWMQFDASKTSFVNQIWNPYCVGAPDSIIGWTVTAADNTVSNILHANNSGPAYWIIVDQYAFGPAPYTFQSPDYVPASTNDVHIEVGGHNWNFGANGITSLSKGINVSDNLTLQVSGIPNAVTGLTGSPQGGWSGSYTNLSTTGGSGTGLTVNASESGSGYIDTVTINTPGHGYTNGDTITITSGGATAFFTISILSAQSWTFDGHGNVTFPDSTVQTTAYTGSTYGDSNVAAYLSTNVPTGTYSNSNVTSYLSSSTATVANLVISGSAPSSLTGSAGDTAGMIRADSNYIYYCTADWTSSSYTVGWEGASGNTIFLTKGSYPTPQVGWAVSNTSGYGPWTINTITDNGTNWRITFVGTPYGEAGGGTATLTNPNPATIWTKVPWSATNFSNANVASYLVANPQAGTYSNTNVSSYLSGGVTTGNLTTAGNVVQQSAYYERYGNVSNTGGNLTCNFNLGTVFYANLSANVTANFTNVNAISSTVTGATIIVDQGATAYRVANVQVNGVNQTVKWVGATAGAGTASNTDVMSFSLINLGGGAYRVLAQISHYG